MATLAVVVSGIGKFLNRSTQMRRIPTLGRAKLLLSRKVDASNHFVTPHFTQLHFTSALFDHSIR